MASYLCSNRIGSIFSYESPLFIKYSKRRSRSTSCARNLHKYYFFTGNLRKPRCSHVCHIGVRLFYNMNTEQASTDIVCSVQTKLCCWMEDPVFTCWRILFRASGHYQKWSWYYMGADKSLARPTSRCIFYGENISFDASLLLYIYIYIYTHTHTYIVLIFL